MTHIICGIEGCPCGDSGPRNPWRGACGKAEESETAAGWLAKDIERAQKRCAEWRDDPLERTPPVRGYQPSHHRKASNMGFGALTVGERARAKVGSDVFHVTIPNCMERIATLEFRIERALEMLKGPFIVIKPQPRDGWQEVLDAGTLARAILRGDA